MHDHRQLARQGDFGLLHARPAGNSNPALKLRTLDRSGQDDVCRLVKSGPHLLIAALGYATCDVCLARLVFALRQAKMRTDRSR